MGISTQDRLVGSPTRLPDEEPGAQSPLEHERLTTTEIEACGIDDLLAEYLPMIENIARSYSAHLPPQIEFDDLVVAGALGFVEAVERYDASRGVPLEKYASIRIRGAIQDELRRCDWMPRAVRKITTQLDRLSRVVEHQICRRATDSDMASALGIEISCLDKIHVNNPVHSTTNLDELSSGAIQPIEKELWDSLIADTDDLSPELHQPTLSEELTIAMDALNSQQQMVMQLYYFGEQTMREIGDELGLSEGRISQIHARALEIMRHRMKDLENDPSLGN